MENLIVFIGYTHELPIVLGMLGKENLEYLSKFDAGAFNMSKTQIYHHKGLNSKIYLYHHLKNFLDEPKEFFKKFQNCIIVDGAGFHFESRLLEDKIFDLNISWPNVKRVLFWPYGEVFEIGFINRIKQIEYDLIFSASKRPELQTDPNFQFDLLFSFRYFRYYIGYYYLEDLVNNMPLPKYDKSKPKLFSYSRTHGEYNWRNKILDWVGKSGKLLEPKDSANDAYDLAFPKYKHFEAINDYLYCNYNLILETIDYSNNHERFITEKTYKGLFFGKPILLATCYETLNELKDLGFYLLNFDFVENINTIYDVEKSIVLFSEWLAGASDDEIEEKYNQSLEKSIQNRHKLMSYLNDYSEMEKIFNKLL